MVMIEAHCQPAQVPALYLFILEVCTQTQPSAIFLTVNMRSSPYTQVAFVDIDADATLVDGVDQLRRIRKGTLISDKADEGL